MKGLDNHTVPKGTSSSYDEKLSCSELAYLFMLTSANEILASKLQCQPPLLLTNVTNILRENPKKYGSSMTDCSQANTLNKRRNERRSELKKAQYIHILSK